jgi:hypothetical protein
LNFLFDNCISPHLAKAIDVLEGDAGNTVIALRDKFPQTTADVDWIRDLGAESLNWIVISGDTRISRNKHEHEAWLEARLTFFFWAPGWLHLGAWQQAWKLIKWWPTIVDQAAKIAPGAGFMIPAKSNRLEQIQR